MCKLKIKVCEDGQSSILQLCSSTASCWLADKTTSHLLAVRCVCLFMHVLWLQQHSIKPLGWKSKLKNISFWFDSACQSWLQPQFSNITLSKHNRVCLDQSLWPHTAQLIYMERRSTGGSPRSTEPLWKIWIIYTSFPTFRAVVPFCRNSHINMNNEWMMNVLYFTVFYLEFWYP